MNFDNSNISDRPAHALTSLPQEDLDLITELVLHSGSLKDLANSYEVSYPTIRVRLDRVIQRLREAIAGREPDALSDLLATLVERGELSITNARTVRQAARDLLNGRAGAEAKKVGSSGPSSA